MRNPSPSIAPEVQALMAQVRHQVAARLHQMFKAAPMIAAIGEERAARLAEHTALGGATLNWVSTEVREAIVERRPQNKLGQFGLWHVIDAIGNISDCVPGRWPYMTDENRRTRLQWAGEELDAVERAMAQAMSHESQPQTVEAVAA